MARNATSVTLGQSLGGGRYNSSSTTAKSASVTASLVTDVESAVAAAEAAAGAVSQTEVGNIRTAWDLLKVQPVALSANVVVDYDTAIITSRNQLRATLDQAVLNVAESLVLTP